MLPPDSHPLAEPEPQHGGEAATPEPGNAGLPAKPARRRHVRGKPRPTRAAAPSTPRAPRAPRAIRPQRAPAEHGASPSYLDEEDGFFKRHAIVLAIGVLAAAGAAFAYFHKPGPTASPVKQERILMISPLPPPPPPPPPLPPPPQKAPEEKMEKETAPAEEPKPVEKPAPVKAPDDPAPLGTNLKGDGPGLSGLGSGSGLGGGTLGSGTGNKGGSRFGWYAGQVQSKITQALSSHPGTKNASLRIEVRIWPDSTGRITRAQLVGSTGDPKLDGVIQDNVLTGLQLQSPPPAGMRLPIVLRLTARRPN